MKSDGSSSGSATPGQPVNITGMPDAKPKEPVMTAPKAQPATPVTAQSGGKVADYHTIIDLLALVKNREASDLHLTTDAPPHLRIDGELIVAVRVGREFDFDDIAVPDRLIAVSLRRDV